MHFHLIVLIYSLIATMFSLIVPTAMLLGLVWLFVKMFKKFYRSITK